MISFKLSKDLAKDLAMHLQPPLELPRPAMEWYGQRFTIEERACVIMMEAQTRYALVFCDLTPRDFQDFPALFQERLWREVAILTQLDKPLSASELDLLNERVLDMCSEEIYQLGSDRSVGSHITQVRQHLEIMLYIEGYPLPVSADDALQFGMIANDTSRKRHGRSDYFYPVREFYNFWIGVLKEAKGTAPQEKPQRPKTSGNVIWGRFNKQ